MVIKILTGLEKRVENLRPSREKKILKLRDEELSN